MTAERWRRLRAPALLAGAVVVAAVAMALLGAGARAGQPLDPDDPSPDGARALVQVLQDGGVQVREVDRLAEVRRAAGRGTTVLLADPALLAASQARELAGLDVPVVVIEPSSTDLSLLAGEVTLVGFAEPDGDGAGRPPGCQLYAAERAGRTTLAGLLYRVDPGQGSACYPQGPGAPLVVLPPAPGADGGLVILGDGAALSNERVTEEGNAALALALLGQHPTLLWYTPSPLDTPPGQARTLGQLVPDGVRFGVVQLVVAAALLALWRARRLGPVVREPLPVVVRPAEVVEGRARLYRRTGARGRAAEHLRAAARRTLGRRLGLPPAVRGGAGEPAPEALVAAVAARTGRPPGELGPLLYGAPPDVAAVPDLPDDTALVRLADALDTLDREVRPS